MIRTALLGAAAAALLSTAALADRLPSITVGNVNVAGTQNIASQTQLGVLNFQIQGLGDRVEIEAPQRAPYLEVEKQLVTVDVNASALVAIYNTDTKIEVKNTLIVPVEIDVENSFNAGVN